MSLPNTHVFGRWEDAGVPRENPPRHWEELPTPHRKTPAEVQTVKPLTVRGKS